MSDQALRDFTWETTRLVERCGPFTFELDALADFGRSAAQVDAHLRGRADAGFRVDVSPMFGVIWGSARALCDVLLEQELVGVEVLELAAGLALPSLVAARMGARVLATDFHPSTQPFLRSNAARAGVEVDYAPLDLRTGDLGRRFEVVLASDVLYARDLPQVVAAGIARHLAPGGRAWLADPGRPWLQDFVDACEADGLSVDLQVREALSEEIFVLSLL